MNMRSDEPELRDLMLAGLDGNAAAHKALLTRLSANLRAYFKTHLARMGKGPADAEDLVQETLIALHTRRHTYDRSKPLTPWVYAIARYRLVDFLRRTRTSMTDVAIDEAYQVPADDNPASVGIKDRICVLSPISARPTTALETRKASTAMSRVDADPATNARAATPQ